VPAAASFTTLVAFAATVVDLLREFDGVGSGVIEGMLEGIGGTILDGEFEKLRRGPSEKITDTHNYSLDGCSSVNSAEFFFDGTSAARLARTDQSSELRIPRRPHGRSPGHMRRCSA
jgi:hypothetical protein